MAILVTGTVDVPPVTDTGKKRIMQASIGGLVILILVGIFLILKK